MNGKTYIAEEREINLPNHTYDEVYEWGKIEIAGTPSKKKDNPIQSW